ncbi:MAG TPA: FISUMP domain-containing protein [Bacteroidales bacterium]|nr:FISUMP domain-containing protein [Bacteroidales bacterium]HSA42189.1 FISUMP domain-containing protein [Bacteroidales bacterium]
MNKSRFSAFKWLTGMVFLFVIPVQLSAVLPYPACAYITGQVIYFNQAGTPLSQVTVSLMDADGQLVESVQTDEEGHFLFCAPAGGLFTLNLNTAAPAGGFNAGDALSVLQYFTGVQALSGLNLAAADVNGSQYVNTTDALLILKRFAEQTGTFPAGDWLFESPVITAVPGDTVEVAVRGLCYGDPDGSFVPASCPGFLEYGGQTYPCIQIGTQCWMKENLNVGVMIDSTSEQTDNGLIEKYCYNDNPANCDVYGGLYQWNEMMQYVTTPGARGICPEGWHIPDNNDWCTLTTFLDASVNCNSFSWTGSVAGGKLKESGLVHWNAPNTGGTNESGFTALPAGYRSSSGFYNNRNLYAFFWMSNTYTGNKGLYLILNTSHADIQRYHYPRAGGYSVRCVMTP